MQVRYESQLRTHVLSTEHSASLGVSARRPSHNPALLRHLHTDAYTNPFVDAPHRYSYG